MYSVFEANYVALGEDYFDVFFVQFLEGSNDLVEGSYFMVNWLLQGLEQGFPLVLKLFHLKFKLVIFLVLFFHFACHVDLFLPEHFDFGSS